nr:NosD domain-containing protein [Methanothermococcus okinawensis]
MDFNLYGDPSLSLNNKVNLNKKIFINYLPYNIEIPGYYILNTSCENLTTTAITIDANNVVLDGNGHILDRNTTNWHWKCGIYVNNHKNITIKNLAVKGFDEGIYLGSSSNNTITNVNVSINYGDGIILNTSFNNNITNNNFNNCGLCIWKSYHNTIKNNTVNGKPLVYLENEKDKVIDNAGQL